MKLADITPIFKKDDPRKIKNYRPVSVLPSVLKVFEKLNQNQIAAYVYKFLATYLGGSRKGYSTKQASVSFIKKVKISLDNKDYNRSHSSRGSRKFKGQVTIFKNEYKNFQKVFLQR